MKRILLASASIVAFAGAAAAEITFSGEATLGYNDFNSDTVDGVSVVDDTGFYWDASIDVTMSQTLDNGLTASATFGLNVVDGNLGEDVASSDYVLSLTSDTAGLYFGNTEFAAVKHWTGAGEMDADGFSEEDGETVLRGDITYGGVNSSVSYAVDSANDSLEQLSLGADATFGTISVALGYQEETSFPGVGGDFNPNKVLGVSAGTSFAGADVRLAFAQESFTDSVTGDNVARQSIGVSASYPFGPVTLGAYYVMESGESDGIVDPEDNDSYGITADYVSGPLSVSASYEVDQQDASPTEDQTVDWELTGSYDVGNGITAFAGVVDAGDDYYVAGSMALGEGATLLVSYVKDGDEDDSDDEVGPNDYQEGATVELGFSF